MLLKCTPTRNQIYIILLSLTRAMALRDIARKKINAYLQCLGAIRKQYVFALRGGRPLRKP